MSKSTNLILRGTNSFGLFAVSSAYNQKNCQFVSFNSLLSLYMAVAILCYGHASSTKKKNGKLISNPTMPVFVLLKTESTMGKVSESHQHDKLELHFICQRLFVCLFLSNY